MPTYQYKREDGSVFEVLQGINDEPLSTCPETGQKVSRIITGGAGVVYKGDGWYVTDYKRKEENANGSSDKSTNNSNTNGSSNGKSESKTDTKSASSENN